VPYPTSSGNELSPEEKMGGDGAYRPAAETKHQFVFHKMFPECYFLESESQLEEWMGADGPLSRECGTYSTVMASFWPWHEPLFRQTSLKSFKVFPARSAAVRG